MLLIHNAIIINEGERFHGHIEVRDGRIARIGRGPAPQDLIEKYGESVHDAQGHWLLPGVIDSHVHFREPGMTHKADIRSESRAAVLGGVSSFMEMPNTSPATTTLEALEQKHEIAAACSLANYSFYIGATSTNMDELEAVDYTRVPGIKLFMGSSTGGMLVEREEALERIFKMGQLVAVHCEDEAIIRENLARVKHMYKVGEGQSGDDLPFTLHPEIRSTLACYASTAAAVERARRHGTRLHVMHLTTEEELALFEPGDRQITAEACIAHLLFSDEDYAKLGARIKCNPAVKGPRHRAALREAVRRGLIRTVSTDHAPHTLKEKMRPLLSAPSGMPMVQYSLPVMLHLAGQGQWTPEHVVQLMCHNQADNFGVVDRGYLRDGYWADIVEVDPDGVTEIHAQTGSLSKLGESTIASKCGWSPLEGMSLRGRVVSTWVNGEQVVGEGSLLEPASTPAKALIFNR